MAYFDDMTEQEIRQNKAIRGYIVRALAFVICRTSSEF